MIKTKKLGLGICMVAIGAMMLAIPASAKSSGSDYYTLELDSYTQPGYESPNKYTNDQWYEVVYQSRITNSDVKYYDSAIRKKAEDYLSRGYLVGDLRNLTEFGITGLAKDNDYVFNHGIVSTDDVDSPSWLRIDCKCSDKDFKEFYNYIKKGYNLKEVEKNTFDTSDKYADYIRIKYNSDTDVLTFYEEY